MANVLLAEDNPADVYLIQEALKEYGVQCRVQVASDGKEVLEVISRQGSLDEKERLDLIILDLNLPCHDGLEILRELRAAGECSRIPVVVLTSSDSPRDKSMASDLGASSFLRKPANLEEFLSLGEVFRDLLNKANAHSNGS